MDETWRGRRIRIRSGRDVSLDLLCVGHDDVVLCVRVVVQSPCIQVRFFLSHLDGDRKISRAASSEVLTW